MPAIRTIGYERAGFDDFVESLKAAGVSHIFDVRDLPLSRRAGFSKTNLAAGLAKNHIAYTHLKGLRTPKEGRIASKARDYVRFWAIVAEKMKTPEAQLDLERAKTLVTVENCCLLCFEADPHVCHRLEVAKALERDTNFEIVHLGVPGASSSPPRKPRIGRKVETAHLSPLSFRIRR